MILNPKDIFLHIIGVTDSPMKWRDFLYEKLHAAVPWK